MDDLTSLTYQRAYLGWAAHVVLRTRNGIHYRRRTKLIFVISSSSAIEGIYSRLNRQASRKLLLTGGRLQVEASCPRFTRSPEKLGCSELGFHQEALPLLYGARLTRAGPVKMPRRVEREGIT